MTSRPSSSASTSARGEVRRVRLPGPPVAVTEDVDDDEPARAEPLAGPRPEPGERVGREVREDVGRVEEVERGQVHVVGGRGHGGQPVAGVTSNPRLQDLDRGRCAVDRGHPPPGVEQVHGLRAVAEPDVHRGPGSRAGLLDRRPTAQEQRPRLAAQRVAVVGGPVLLVGLVGLGLVGLGLGRPRARARPAPSPERTPPDQAGASSREARAHAFVTPAGFIRPGSRARSRGASQSRASPEDPMTVLGTRRPAAVLLALALVAGCEPQPVPPTATPAAPTTAATATRPPIATPSPSGSVAPSAPPSAAAPKARTYAGHRRDRRRPVRVRRPDRPGGARLGGEPVPGRRARRVRRRPARLALDPGSHGRPHRVGGAGSRRIRLRRGPWRPGLPADLHLDPPPPRWRRQGARRLPGGAPRRAVLRHGRRPRRHGLRELRRRGCVDDRRRDHRASGPPRRIHGERLARRPPRRVDDRRVPD